MSVAWTLRRANGQERSLADWGISDATLRLINLGLDTLELKFGRTDMLASLPFDPDETLVLLRDGTICFRGRITGEKRGAYGSTEGITLVLSGPWWYLKKSTYGQTVRYPVDPFANPAPANPVGLQPGDFTLAQQITSFVVLGMDGLGNSIHSDVMIQDALAFAIAIGAPIAVGTVDAGIYMPKDAQAALTCEDVILRSIRWTPDQSGWWDYSVNPPRINIRSRANRALLSLDIANGEIAQVEINPNRDKMVSAVVIRYIRQNDRINFTFTTQEIDKAGPLAITDINIPLSTTNPVFGHTAGVGALVITINLAGSYMAPDHVDNTGIYYRVVNPEITPVGLAAALYNAYKDPPYEGLIVLAGDDVPATVWLGRTIRVLNGAPAWATAVMDVQQVTLDIFRGRTELTVGLPRQLGPADLVGLLSKLSSNNPTPKAKLLFGGGSPSSPNIPPNNADPRTLFVTQPDIILRDLRGRDIGFPGSFGTYASETFRVFATHDTSVPPVDSTLGPPNTGDVINFHGFIVGKVIVYQDVPNSGPFITPKLYTGYLDDLSHDNGV